MARPTDTGALSSTPSNPKPHKINATDIHLLPPESRTEDDSLDWLRIVKWIARIVALQGSMTMTIAATMTMEAPAFKGSKGGCLLRLLR